MRMCGPHPTIVFIVDKQIGDILVACMIIVLRFLTLFSFGST